MADFLRTLLNFIEFLWPLRRVEEWERGGYYVVGRWRAEVGPGAHFVVPWFCEVKTVSTAEAIIGTGRLDVTLADGALLSFAASATVRVSDAYKALNAVDEYRETATELLSSVVADLFSEEKVASFEAGLRRGLQTKVSNRLNGEGEGYGLTFGRVRLTSCVVAPRAHRLLIDQTTGMAW